MTRSPGGGARSRKVEDCALLEEILGASLDAPVTADGEGDLRSICGAILAGPQFLLTGLPPR